MFIEGILDVVVSCIYRLILRLNEAVKQRNMLGFFVKMITYCANKISRYYIKYYPPKNKKEITRSMILWPIAAIFILINLIFDFTYNYFVVYRSLHNKIAWLNPLVIIGLSYAYMVISSLESCYSNAIAWYGILQGGFNDASIKVWINVFFVCVGLLEAALSSLYFMITTKMVLVWAIPTCILLYFLPPFIQKFVDGNVQMKCVGNSQEEKKDSLYNKIIAGYIVTANVVGLIFQLSSFTANISAGLPWLSAAMVTTLAYWFIGFYVFHALLTNSYTMMQYLFKVDFAADWIESIFGKSSPAPTHNNGSTSSEFNKNKLGPKNEDDIETSSLLEDNNYLRLGGGRNG